MSTKPKLFELEPIRLPIPPLARPTLQEIQQCFPDVVAIERDTSPITAVRFTLGTVLVFKFVPGTDGMTGGEQILHDEAEFLSRISPYLHRLLGYQHLEWLRVNQEAAIEYESSSAARNTGKREGYLYNIRFTGTFIICAYGTMLRTRKGALCVPCLTAVDVPGVKHERTFAPIQLLRYNQFCMTNQIAFNYD